MPSGVGLDPANAHGKFTGSIPMSESRGFSYAVLHRATLHGRQPHQQQSLCRWIGGQGTLPKEQNTQQSPLAGRRRALQLGHS
jgi:hypothetical protein